MDFLQKISKKKDLNAWSLGYKVRSYIELKQDEYMDDPFDNVLLIIPNKTGILKDIAEFMVEDIKMYDIEKVIQKYIDEHLPVLGGAEFIVIKHASDGGSYYLRPEPRDMHKVTGSGRPIYSDLPILTYKNHLEVLIPLKQYFHGRD